MRSQGSGCMAIIILLITGGLFSSGAVGLSEGTGESTKETHVFNTILGTALTYLQQQFQEDVNASIFGVSQSGQKYNLENVSTGKQRRLLDEGSCAVCDFCLPECLAPILVEFAVNIVFYDGRRRSMDLPFPERMYSIFSSWFHSWKSDPAINGRAYVV